MIKIAANRSGTMEMLPLGGAKVRAQGEWITIKPSDKIYLNGQWHEVGGETAPTSYKEIRLVDSQSGIDMTFAPMKAGIFDLTGFGMGNIEITSSGPHRVWYGVDNITGYPMIVLDDRNSTPTVDGSTQWLVYMLIPDTLGGSTGTAERYYEQMGDGFNPYDGSGYYCVNGGYTPSPEMIFTLTDIETEPVDPVNLFPN